MFSHLPDLIDQAAKTHNDGYVVLVLQDSEHNCPPDLLSLSCRTQKLLFKATAEHARMLHDIILGATHEYVKKTHKK